MIQQQFDAVAFEQECVAKFEQSESFSVELSSCHDYNDGITYHSVHCGDLELGRYWKHPWSNGWLYRATGVGDGIQHEADTDYEAIALIKQSWSGVL